MNNVPNTEFYPKMKASGTAWLKDIPYDWKVSQLGSLYVPRNERVSDKDYPPLSVTMKGIVPQLSSAAKTDDGDNRLHGIFLSLVEAAVFSCVICELINGVKISLSRTWIGSLAS